MIGEGEPGGRKRKKNRTGAQKKKKLEQQPRASHLLSKLCSTTDWLVCQFIHSLNEWDEVNSCWDSHWLWSIALLTLCELRPLFLSLATPSFKKHSRYHCFICPQCYWLQASSVATPWEDRKPQQCLPTASFRIQRDPGRHVPADISMGATPQVSPLRPAHAHFVEQLGWLLTLLRYYLNQLLTLPITSHIIEHTSYN